MKKDLNWNNVSDRKEIIALCGGSLKFYWSRFLLSFRSKKWIEAENKRLKEQIAMFEQQAENEPPEETDGGS